METILIAAAVLCAVIIVLLIVVLVQMKNLSGYGSADIRDIKKQIEFMNRNDENNNRLLMDQTVRQHDSVVSSITVLGDSLRDAQEKQRGKADESLTKIEAQMRLLRKDNQESFDKIRTEVTASLESMRSSNTESLERLRKDNRDSLDRINDTVNEKLQKTLDDKIARSFEAVNKRLAEVYEGLGEMKNVASGVTDLKNVLSNVKARGTMGEIRLGAILSEILAPEQFCEQAAVIPNSSERVDFAVRLPGAEDGEYVYLPIDSKFPGDTYSNYLAAFEGGAPAEIKNRRDILEREIRRCGKSIHDKYICPPYTTDFAIMFLPFEGLYAEVVNMGLVEVLQREFKINIAGPSTMAAMLNSLQMGFKTLAIQKKSSEVWKILEDAKKEFSSFETTLTAVRSRLRQADDELDKLIGTRTRAINRKLKDVYVTEEPEETKALPMTK
ncbi:MAG: DNA recombination protein RmuC [Oscillospiraceae bacterium]